MDDVVFVGDWIKDRVLGSGSFGTVVLWKHKRTDEKLAIKTCKWGDELTEKHKDRWSKEVEMMQSCKNPNIVGTKELPPEFIQGLERANPSKLPILCMEYCSGGDLRHLLNKPESCAGLKELKVRQILSDIGNALQFLHSNKITHRDLKPENIVMHILDDSKRGNIGAEGHRDVTYKLIDLGYAKEMDANSLCASFVGTLQYLAPEIFHSKTYSNSVDFWSFGLLAFEIICGTRPFLPFMAPVQWMPYVKKKAHENISIYETFHGDVEYSNEIFSENYITKPLKVLIEKWLQVALEWDPKLRGRDAPAKVTFNILRQEQAASNIVFFNLLETILSKKIIKIFSVPTLSNLEYEIDATTTINAVKSFIKNNTGIEPEEQLLISQLTYSNIDDGDFAAKYWNDQCGIMLYLFNKGYIIKGTIETIVPQAVQRCLEHPKQLYNFKNSQNLYRSGLYFVISTMETYESLINSLVIKGESLKYVSKQLLVKHNTVDKTFGKLLTKEESLMTLVDTGKKHVQALRDSGSGANFLGGFDKIFKNADELTEKINKLQTAWSQLTVRLQSAARRSNEGLAVDLNTFTARFNFQAVFTNAMKSYITYKKTDSERRGKDKQCIDIMKICYDCLKMRSRIISEIQNQPFILKMADLSTEFAKIAGIITGGSNNTDKLTADLTSVMDELNNCLWATISILSSDADNLAELPYSVVSFHKQDFKIGEAVTTNPVKTNHKEEVDESLKSLIEDSLKLWHNQNNLSHKIKTHKKVLEDSKFDFSFLSDK